MNTNPDSNNNTLANIATNSLSHASSAIDVTKKILSESQYEFHGDFKGENIWHKELKEIFGRITAMKICPYSDRLLVGCSDGYLRILNDTNGEEIIRKKFGENITDITIGIGDCEGNKYLFIATSDGVLHKVNLSDFQIIKSVLIYKLEDYFEADAMIYPEHNRPKGMNFKIKASPSGLLLLTKATHLSDKVYGTIDLNYIFQIGIDRDINTAERNRSWKHNVDFWSNSKVLLSIEEECIWLYNIPKNERNKVLDLNAHLKSTFGKIDVSLLVNAPKRQVAIYSFNGKWVHIMDIMTEKISHSIKLESNLSTIQFSNNGNYLMLDTYNSGAYYRKDSNTLYDTKSFKSIYTENHPHGHDIPYKIFGKNDKSIYGGYRNSYRNDNIINIYKWD